MYLCRMSKVNEVLIAPSVLSADFANLQRDIEMINDSAADWFHVDVMDGMFVPNISFGMPVIKALKKHATKPLDVHLMIVQPEKYIADFRQLVPIFLLYTPRLAHTCIELFKPLRLKV